MTIARRRLGRTSVVVLAVCLTVVGIDLTGCDSPPQTGDAADAHRPAAEVVVLTRPEADKEADNSACLDCHADFADEPMVVTHLEEGLGCTACHGESVAHGEDEANVIKPDVLFGRTHVTPFCKLCHPTHPTGEKYDAFVEKWRGERRPTGVMLLEDGTCTDCHGRHILIGEE